MKNFLICLLLLLPLVCLAQGRNFHPHYKGPVEPPFKKIYIEPSQLVTRPDGLYYSDESGTYTQVRVALSDCDGMYVICVAQQCPLCGRSYEGTYLDEAYGYPHFQRTVSSRLWVD